jgi:hypothetical protein
LVACIENSTYEQEYKTMNKNKKADMKIGKGKEEEELIF